MRLRPLLLLLALAAAGCGGADEKPPPRAEPRPENVVRAWADALARGDIDAATDRFAVPAIVANGTPEIRLETRDEVRFFNDTLPCGGRVVGTRRRDGFVIATIRLTNRPGGDCGSGAGNTAKTAFQVRDGKIVRWLRVPLRGDPPARRAPTV
jgi:limonene-1,2-epoxide hydrolase